MKMKQNSIEKSEKNSSQSDKQWPQGTLEVTDQNFNEIVNEYPVVVVDCWAPWCGPCQMVGPVIEEMAKDHQGKIVFGKLNVDTDKLVAGKYGIMSIPTIMIFKDGTLVDQKIGAMPRNMLEPEITKYL